jgi:hypothetical protein
LIARSFHLILLLRYVTFTIDNKDNLKISLSWSQYLNKQEQKKNG